VRTLSDQGPPPSPASGSRTTLDVMPKWIEFAQIAAAATYRGQDDLFSVIDAGITKVVASNLPALTEADVESALSHRVGPDRPGKRPGAERSLDSMRRVKVIVNETNEVVNVLRDR
jgi:hypothetical protein